MSRESVLLAFRKEIEAAILRSNADVEAETAKRTTQLAKINAALRIEYSKSAMEQIHKRARKGLMAAPRVGMGVGGLLLGSHQNTSFRLLDSIEIPCSHSGGPSFNLAFDPCAWKTFRRS